MRELKANFDLIISDLTPRVSSSELEAKRTSFRLKFEPLQQAGITTYAALYALVADPAADLALRLAGCDLLDFFISLRQAGYPKYKFKKIIDKKEALPSLLAALQSESEALRDKTIQILGDLGHKKALPALIAIVTGQHMGGNRITAIRALSSLDDSRATLPILQVALNKNEDEFLRIWALIAVCDLNDERVIAPLTNLIADTTDNTEIRSIAAENLARHTTPEILSLYIKLLSDSEIDLRFWAAYGLVTLSHSMDIGAALSTIDHLAAYDHAVSPRMWAISREIIPALESIWYQRLAKDKQRWITTYLISPLLEYWDYMQASTHLENEQYQYIPFVQHTDLQIDPAWFITAIQAKWKTAQVNVRQPKPEALLLDWTITTKNGLLMGGLHRDGYTLFLTGDEDDMLAFAVWYRGIIATEYTLRLYCWADPGAIIEIGMTPAELSSATENLY